MNTDTTFHERYAFFSDRKDQETLNALLAEILPLPLEEIRFEFPNRPNESFSHINDRNRKIIMSLPGSEKISSVGGSFSDGGTFSYHGGTLGIEIPADQYNFELSEAMRKFLSPTFPICIFRNPYIWAVDLYYPFERELLFETRNFVFRSKHLEEPQIDIFRRDDGIVFKIRFHIDPEATFEQGLRIIHPMFEEIRESLRKNSYETLEILSLYCSDRKLFRQYSPRTKWGTKLKPLLFDSKDNQSRW